MQSLENKIIPESLLEMVTVELVKEDAFNSEMVNQGFQLLLLPVSW